MSRLRFSTQGAGVKALAALLFRGNWLQLCLLVTCLATIGCSRVIPEFESFGAVRGLDAKRSVNGLAVHKKMWETTGSRCLFPRKLSPRLETFDTIVLVGQSYGPPGRLARQWLEDWLNRGENRTVIYFGRDFNADLYYRQRTLNSVAEEQREQANRDYAKSRTLEMSTRMREISESTFCRWFYYDTSQTRVEYTSSDFEGQWSTEVQGLTGTWPVGITLQVPRSEWQKNKPTWLAPGAPANPLKPANAPLIPEEDPDGETVFSEWDQQELSTAKLWDSEFEDLMESEILLQSKDGRPLIFRLKPEFEKTSQILIVANGAPFLNASLVEPLHRQVGRLLVESCVPSDRVALLAYGSRGLTISKTAERETQASGLEFLTTWPLSAVTIPAALFGIVVCCVLLPILGRPQSLPARSVTDFGLHIDALGKMLLESKDEAFARQAIREYFQKVRGEHPPEWLGAATPTSPASVAESAKSASPGRVEKGKPFASTPPLGNVPVGDSVSQQEASSEGQMRADSLDEQKKKSTEGKQASKPDEDFDVFEGGL